MLVSLTPSPALAGSLCPYSENQWLNWTLVVQTGLACPPFSLAPKGSCLGSLAWAGARASVWRVCGRENPNSGEAETRSDGMGKRAREKTLRQVERRRPGDVSPLEAGFKGAPRAPRAARLKSESPSSLKCCVQRLAPWQMDPPGPGFFLLSTSMSPVDQV